MHTCMHLQGCICCIINGASCALLQWIQGKILKNPVASHFQALQGFKMLQAYKNKACTLKALESPFIWLIRVHLLHHHLHLFHLLLFYIL